MAFLTCFCAYCFDRFQGARRWKPENHLTLLLVHVKSQLCHRSPHQLVLHRRDRVHLSSPGRVEAHDERGSIQDEHFQPFSLSEDNLLRLLWRNESPNLTKNVLFGDFLNDSDCPIPISRSRRPSITRLALGPGSATRSWTAAFTGTTIDLTGWRGAISVSDRLSIEVSRTGPPAEKEWAVDPVGVETIIPSALAWKTRLPLRVRFRLSIFAGMVGRRSASLRASPKSRFW